MACEVRTHDEHLSCVMCVHWPACACQNSMQQCVSTPAFLSFARVKHASACMFSARMCKV